MDLFRYIVRFFYKIRWYLVILPLIALIVAWFSTRNMERIYDTSTTIYTGMITGYNIEGATGGGGGGNAQTNSCLESVFRMLSSWRMWLFRRFD